MRRRLLRLSLVALAFMARGNVVQACEACLEDKIAATYDWQVVSTAQRLRHTVVFTAIQGRVAPGGAGLERSLARRPSAEMT